MEDSFVGVWLIDFIGLEGSRRVEVVSWSIDSHGHPIFLIGTNGTRYNWSNIIKMAKEING